VELAQLNYLLPRLTGRGTSMSRLGGKSGGGGAGGAGGGAGRIGVRGPGKRNWRPIAAASAIASAKFKPASKVSAQRALGAVKRRESPSRWRTCAGDYTSAGKAALFKLSCRAEYRSDRAIVANWTAFALSRASAPRACRTPSMLGLILLTRSRMRRRSVSSFFPQVRGRRCGPRLRLRHPRRTAALPPGETSTCAPQ